MKRGDVFTARLDPAEGSEQAGRGRRIYPSQALLQAPEGGLRADSIALGEQVRAVAKSRLRKRWGTLSPGAMQKLDLALLITLDLPGQ